MEHIGMFGRACCWNIEEATLPRDNFVISLSTKEVHQAIVEVLTHPMLARGSAAHEKCKTDALDSTVCK